MVPIPAELRASQLEGRHSIDRKVHSFKLYLIMIYMDQSTVGSLLFSNEILDFRVILCDFALAARNFKAIVTEDGDVMLLRFCWWQVA